MTLHYERSGIVFECDACGDTLDTETREFDEANTMRAQEGWRAAPGDRGVWEHECAVCQRKTS